MSVLERWDFAHHAAIEHDVLDQHAIVSVADQTGRIVYVNDRFCVVSGYQREELLGQNHRVLKSGHHTPEFYADIWKTISNGEIWHGEICNQRKDGNLYWVSSTIQPIKNEKGVITHYFSIRTEITELKNAEALNRQYEERLRRGQRYANIGTWEWQINTGELFWTEGIGPLFGYQRVDIEASYDNFLNAVHPDDRAKVEAAVNNCIENDTPYEIEHRVVWPDGTVRWLLERGAVTRDEEGKPLRMLGVVQDIDNRKRTELALSERERQLSEAQKIAKMGHWNADLVTGELDWSDQIFDIFGQDPQSFAPTVTSFFDAVHPEDRERVRESQIEAASNGRQDVTHRIVRPDGSVRHVHELARAEVDEDGELVRLVGTIQDITDQFEAGQRLRRTEELFAFAVDGAGDGVWEWNVQADEITFAGQYASMLGISPGNLPGSLTAWMALVHPDDYEHVKETLAKSAGGSIRTFNCEVRLYHRTEGYKWVLCRGTATDYRPDGKPLRIVAIHTDISDRKRAELALITAREEAEKANRAKSDFLSSMSHELRTPLNSILGFAQLLEMDETLSEDNKDNVHEISRAGRHLLALINEVLDLAKIESENYTFSIEPVSVGPIVEDCLGLLNPVAKINNIRLDHRLETCPAVLSDQTRLKQILLNILSNAIKYNRPGGSVELSCGLSEDGLYQLRIIDTGAGIPEDRIDEMFEPFNRLGAEHSGIEGTGIGLAITRKLLELMNGRISVQSTLGKGSVFTIELPIAGIEEKAPAEHVKADQKPVYDGDMKTILYIEDNVSNVKLFKPIMEQRRRFNVVTAHDPYLGLDLARSSKPDLICVDINLPGLSGYELLEILKFEDGLKDCPVIAVSANAMPKDIRKGIDAGFSDYITKPLDVSGLLHAVDRVLGTG